MKQQLIQEIDIKNYFTDGNIQELFLSQLTELPQIYHQSIKYDKIYLEINYSQFIFAITINKQFPVGGVRLYLINGQTEPQICDIRNLMVQCLGQKWTFRKRLKDISDNIQNLVNKLKNRSQNPLAIQKTGQFVLLDKFYYQQLQNHKSLSLFKPLNHDIALVLGVTQTHLLIFKQQIQNHKGFYSKSVNSSEILNFKKKTFNNKLFLSKSFDLQCITEMKINSDQKQIIIAINLYKSIKSFNEHQTIIKKYVIDQYELFIRNILKYIARFQTTKMDFIPKATKNQNQKILKCLKLQENLKKYQSNLIKLQQKQKSQLIQSLHKVYQLLIQDYSSRASPYYLVFVHKINSLYIKYHPKKMIYL